MRTTYSLSGLVLVSALFGAGCNLTIDGDPIQGWPGHAGSAGSGQAGEAGQAGQAGGAGYAGSGQAGYAGSGQAGTGGLAGQAGTGGGVGIPTPAKFVLTGGDVVEETEVFPFGVAIGPDGAVFVSTLGNRNNEPSRIYRFNPGTTSNPEVLFEVGNAEAAAVYGLAFDNQGRLHACAAQHINSAGNNINAVLLHFDPAQLGEHFLGFNNVVNSELRTTAVNVNGSFVVSNAQQAGRCGPIAFDGELSIFAPDVSGETDVLYRYNTVGFFNQPGGQLGEPISDETLFNLTMTAWASDPLYVGGSTFGVTGIAASEDGILFVREDAGAQVFTQAVSGFFPQNGIGDVTLATPLQAPFGLAAFSHDTLLASSRESDELVLLFLQDGNFVGTPVIDADTDASFRQPAGIAIRGDDVVVAASQIDLLGSSAAEPFKLFSLRLSGF